jgi:hypoxia up-regulated 1
VKSFNSFFRGFIKPWACSDKVIVQARYMVVKSYDQVKTLTDSLYLPYDIVEDSRGATALE